MLVTQQAIFRKFWHAIMPLSELKDGPRPFKLLGVEMVLFLDERGAPAALRDRCCHRTAKLSKGWCINGEGQACSQGNIRCGYHGWVYDRTGQVKLIPQLDASRTIAPEYKTTAYFCQAKYGYVWVALEEPMAEIPPIPEFEAEGWRTIYQFYETWATSPLRALENSFDNSHFSFVHRATFGVAASPKPSKYELVENEQGFYAETIIDAVNPEAFRKISGVSDPITTRHMRNEYFQPFSRRLDIEYPSGIRHVIINCFTPIDDEHIQLCQWLFRNDKEEDCPEAMLVHFDQVITREDKDILESTDPDAFVDVRRRGVEYFMESDKPGMLIRKYLMKLLVENGEQEMYRGLLKSTL